MNKFTKGAIATGAAVVLLMGGAGTLAYWNDSENLTAGATGISSGTLDVAPTGTPAWTVAPLTATTPTNVWGTPQAITNISTFKMVPGDRVTYTAQVNVTATGQTLKATFTPSGFAAASATSGSELYALLNANTTVTVSGLGTPTAGVYTVPANATTLATVTVTVNWPNGTTAVDNAAKLQTVNFTQLGVNVTQVFN